MTGPFRIGTRGSKLALAQARWVQQRLQVEQPGLNVELLVIQTSGDRFTDQPLSAMGGKGLFVKEIEEALTSNAIDCAVHSMKDVPAELAPGLVLAAVPPREDARDACITRGGLRLRDLPDGARVGTGSLRRMALLRALRPALAVEALRGNVDSRLRKLDSGTIDALVLAVAGLRRLNIVRTIEIFDTPGFLPASGQGALAIETRDDATVEVVRCLDDDNTRLAVTAERAFLRRAGGSCRTPLAAYATLQRGAVHLEALIASPDGRQIVRGARQTSAAGAEQAGTALADELLARGGAEILRALETTSPA